MSPRFDLLLTVQSSSVHLGTRHGSIMGHNFCVLHFFVCDKIWLLIFGFRGLVVVFGFLWFFLSWYLSRALLHLAS